LILSSSITLLTIESSAPSSSLTPDLLNAHLSELSVIDLSHIAVANILIASPSLVASIFQSLVSASILFIVCGFTVTLFVVLVVSELLLSTGDSFFCRNSSKVLAFKGIALL